MNAKILTSIIALLLAGGVYGGYKVIRDNKADLFENSLHPVLEVIDGDTIKIPSYKNFIGEDGGVVRLRLIGVDAPEKDECYFEESRDFLEELLTNSSTQAKKEIKIVKDISGEDEFGRLLRYIFLPSDDPNEDDIFIDEMIVKNGYGFAIKEGKNNRYKSVLSAAQEFAVRKKIGMWGECDMSEYWGKTSSAKFREEDSAKPPNPDCTIKGNISERGYGKLYLLEGCPNYNRVKIDVRKGEQYFCTEEEAVEAGFKRSESCDNTF